MTRAQTDERTWGFAEGDEIVPGRSAVRLLGGGHRYEAYLAWDDALHALVVVKVVRPHLTRHEGTLAGMAGEARLLALLAHPSIVRSFDAVLAGERPHLVLEHLDGPRLSTLVRRYGVIVEQLLPLVLQLCSALHYLSGRGIAHLDVKPRNIIMGSTPRLIDLSVARPFEEARRTALPIGTDNYMAPEQADPAGFAEIGPATDVWGLGVTSYEALAGALPFTRVNRGASAPAERYPQLVEEPRPLPRDVPAPVAELVLACLAREPAARPTAAELARSLEPLVATLPRPRLGRFRPGSRPSSPVPVL